MSIINQVLIDLEKRGAQTPLGESSIRPVHRNKFSAVLAISASVSIAAIAIFAWWYSTYPAKTLPPAVAVAASTLNPPAIVPIGVSQPSAAPTVTEAAMSDSVLTQYESLVFAPLILKKELDITALTSTPDVSNKKVMGITAPASRHSASNKIETKISVPAPTADVANKKGTDITALADMPGVTKRIKPVTPQQQAENEYRKGSQYRQQGLVDEAVMAFDAALKLDSSHKLARQSLVVVLLENRRNAEAEQVLKTALAEDPKRTDEAMWLARIQVNNKLVAAALETLQKSLPYAVQRADYLAFIAALYQRTEQHVQAINNYRQALQLVSTNGAWWMGMAISLQAEKRNEEARAAYKRALSSGTLSTELQSYVNSRLQEIH